MSKVTQVTKFKRLKSFPDQTSLGKTIYSSKKLFSTLPLKKSHVTCKKNN